MVLSQECELQQPKCSTISMRKDQPCLLRVLVWEPAAHYKWTTDSNKQWKRVSFSHFPTAILSAKGQPRGPQRAHLSFAFV